MAFTRTELSAYEGVEPREALELTELTESVRAP